MNKEKFISELLSWEGTPFIKNFNVKHKGCDCINLILKSLENIGESVREPDPKYRHFWAKYPIKQLKEEFKSIGWVSVDEPKVGDVVVKIRGNHQIFFIVILEVDYVLDRFKIIASWPRIGVFTKIVNLKNLNRYKVLILRKSLKCK